jgi:hypothetical protein
MAKNVFFSFNYKADAWRAAQVRNMGVVEGNQPVSDNDWEQIARGGDQAIKQWIDEQMKGKSCCVVLIGSATAGRKWINYEIQKAWDDGKGVLGIYIHNLKDSDGRTTWKGRNPFEDITVMIGNNTCPLSQIVNAYDPPARSWGNTSISQQVYDYINQHLAGWVEEAIRIRNKY